jgi:hypothetical protein
MDVIDFISITPNLHQEWVQKPYTLVPYIDWYLGQDLSRYLCCFSSIPWRPNLAYLHREKVKVDPIT